MFLVNGQAVVEAMEDTCLNNSLRVGGNPSIVIADLKAPRSPGEDPLLA